MFGIAVPLPSGPIVPAGVKSEMIPDENVAAEKPNPIEGTGGCWFADCPIVEPFGDETQDEPRDVAVPGDPARL